MARLRYSLFGDASSETQIGPDIHGQMISIVEPISGMAAAALALSLLSLLAFFWVYFAPLVRQAARRRRRRRFAEATTIIVEDVEKPQLASETLKARAVESSVLLPITPPPRVALHPPSPEMQEPMWMPITRESSQDSTGTTSTDRTLTPPQPAYLKVFPPGKSKDTDLEAQRHKPVPF
jgi:hypothetical protein